MIGALTVFTSEFPATLGKSYSLTVDGNLTKSTAGQMTRGTYEVRSFDTVHDLAAILSTLSTAQAISSSLPTSERTAGPVLTERTIAVGGVDVDVDAVSRTKKRFALPVGRAGFALIDVDAPPEGKTLSREELWQLMIDLCPGMTQAGVLFAPSGSSLIYEGETLRQGIKGQHLYVMVGDLEDLPRFGAVLNQRLWLAGLGRIDVSASGSLLERTILDASVYQPARLVFSAGAVCAPPLEQRRGAALPLSDGGFLDTKVAAPDLSKEEHGRFCALLDSAKTAAGARAAEARAAWRASREKDAMKQAIEAGKDPQHARESVARSLDAALHGALLSSFGVVIVTDDGREHTTTVEAILKDRERYHLARCLDPLNPDHRDRTPDAILYLNQPQPIIYSLDGDTVYRLLRQPVRLPVVQGEKARLAEQIADELANHDDLYMMGGQTTHIIPGYTLPVSRALLGYLVGCRVNLYRQGKDKASACEPDAPLLDMVAALLPQRLPTIKARSTIPLIDPSVRIIDRPGFDSGLFLDLDPGTNEAIPQAPTRAQCIEALRRAWAPWSAYKWADSHSRAAMLSALLTLPMRPTIDAAPGLFVDAPAQASGKSKAVGALAAIVRGFKGGAKTWVQDSEAEIEKWVLAVARSGDPAAILDNITGVMRSPALAVAMAEGKASGRLLGVTQTISPDARITWLASGNNASLDRDQSTRWMVARIDTGCEAPSALSYSFDPVDRALADRQGIVRALLTLHRGWHSVGCPRADGIDTRFADWGKVIRHLTLWLAHSGIADGAGIGVLGDPAFSIVQGSSAHDPEQSATAQTWSALLGLYVDQPFTAADVRKVYDAAEHGGDDDAVALREGIEALLSGRGKISTRSLHTVLSHRRDRIAGGLKLQSVPGVGSARGAAWRIVLGQPVDA